MGGAVQKKKGAKYPRVSVIDALRGLSILLMLVHHLAIDLALYGLIPAGLLQSWPVLALHYLFAGVFIAISGMSSFVSRNNLKRGAGLLLAGMAVTLVSWLYDSSFYVKFGILHFLGAAAIIYALWGKAFGRIPRRLSLALIIAGFSASLIFTGKTIESSYFIIFNLYPENFASSDFFPLFPWIFIYFLGAWLAVPVFEGRLPRRFYGLSFPFLEYLGKKTLIIYLLHQPVLIALTIAIAHFFKT
jgi:uncharacterized membrane protein